VCHFFIFSLFLLVLRIFSRFLYSGFNGLHVLEALKKDSAIDNVGENSSFVVRYTTASSKRWALLNPKSIISILMDNDELELIIEPKAELVSKMVYFLAPCGHDGAASEASTLRSIIHESLQTLPLFCSSEVSETLSPAAARSPLSPLSPDVKATHPESIVGVGLLHETAATRAAMELEEMYSKFDLNSQDASSANTQSKDANTSELIGAACTDSSFTNTTHLTTCTPQNSGAEQLTMPTGSGVTSPLLQSAQSPVPSGLFGSGQVLNPEVAASGIAALASGTQSDVALPFDSHTLVAPASNQDFLNTMFQTATSESGAATRHASVADPEPYFEKFGMPTGSGVTSPLLQSAQSPVPSGLFGSGQVLNPEVAASGIAALASGAQSEVALPFDSLTLVAPASNQDFLNTMFQTATSESGAATRHASVADPEPYFEKFGMPTGSGVTSPLLQSAQSPVPSGLFGSGQVLNPEVAASGIAALASGTHSDVALPFDSHTLVAPASNQDFLNTMFQTATSESGAATRHASVADPEPYFEKFGMPTGSGVTSPLLQSAQSPVPSGLFGSGQVLNPEVAASGIAALASGAQSDVALPFDSLTLVAPASNQDFLNTMFQTATSESGAATRHASVADPEPYFEKFGMPTGSGVTSPLLQSAQSPVPSGLFGSGQVLNPEVAASGIAALASGTHSDVALPFDSHTLVAPASNQDFLNTMFQTATSESGAATRHASVADPEPYFEKFGMLTGSGVTSPLLQSAQSPVPSGLFGSGQVLNPEVAASLASGTQSDVASPFDSLTLVAPASNQDFLNTMFQTATSESGAATRHASVADPEPYFEKFGMPTGSGVTSPLLQSAQSPVPSGLFGSGQVLNPEVAASGIAALASGTQSDVSLPIYHDSSHILSLLHTVDSTVPVVSMEDIQSQKIALQSTPPPSPSKIHHQSFPQENLIEPCLLQPQELDPPTADEVRDPVPRRKQTAFSSIGEFLSGFISKKAANDRGMSAVETHHDDTHSQQIVVSSPPLPLELESPPECESRPHTEHQSTVRQYQLIRVPICSSEKSISTNAAIELGAGSQQFDNSDFQSHESKIFSCKLSYSNILDALCQPKQQPHLCIIIVEDSKVSYPEPSANLAVVSEPVASAPSALMFASSVTSSRATSPVPLVGDIYFWRSHVFLDQHLVSQHTSRPGFDQIEHDCVAKCSLFRWDKFDADPTNDALITKFRDIVKFGIPMAFRRPIWLRLSGIKEEELPAMQELYHNRLIMYLGENGPTRIIRYLPHFGQQILWEKAHLINESGRNAAFRILTVLALAHQTKLAFFPMLQDLVGCLLCFLSESEAFFVIDSLIKSELERSETAEDSCPVVLLSTASESLIAGFVIESLRQDMKEVSHSISQATLGIDGKPSWDSALPYLWGMLQGWLRNIWVGHAPLDLAFRSVDLILMRAFDQLGLLKLAVLEHLSAALKNSSATSPSSGEPNGTGVMPMLKALNHITPAEIHSVAHRGLFELKINPTKALARVIKHKVNPPVPASPLAPLSSRSGPKFLGDCTMHYLPNPLPSSSIVQDGHFEFIWKHLDERFKATEDVRRIFNSREHGLSLTV
jgi:hypothetical protein